MEGDERGRAREREAIAGRRQLERDGAEDFSVLFELLKADARDEVAVLICAVGWTEVCVGTTGLTDEFCEGWFPAIDFD